MSHLLGSGTRPSGPSQGKVGVTGQYGAPVSLASGRTSASIGWISSAPTMLTGTIGTWVRIAAATNPPRPNRCRR